MRLTLALRSMFYFVDFMRFLDDILNSRFQRYGLFGDDAKSFARNPPSREIDKKCAFDKVVEKAS